SLMGLAFLLVREERTDWVLPHSRLGLAAMALVNGLFLVFLASLALLPFNHGAAVEEAGAAGSVSPLLGTIEVLWMAVVLLELVFGLVYPALQLNAAKRQAAPLCFKTVYFSFLRRYYGVQFGLLLATISIWVIGYRVLRSLYPWQLEILTTGMGNEEMAVIRVVMSLLTLKS
ncbi:MAG: hypothetical protein NTZ09_07845, partial [Candidatus Hydrogenedentes bacterium]|nr:hypothetical protein [Candidatus Hydrogenedentota bacterium]